MFAYLFLIVLIAYALLAPLGALVLSVIAFRRTTQLTAEIAKLTSAASLEKATKEAELEAEKPLEAELETPLSQPPEEEKPQKSEEAFLAREKESIEVSSPEESHEAPKGPFTAEPSGSWEQRLASKWLLWLGGLTLALGGGFLVKVSIEIGFLGPAVRCFLGALLGLSLTVGGEVLRRRPFQLKLAENTPNYLPPALSAAGVAILFASIYAAYGLYALLPAFLAFTLLGLVAFTAVGLALLQGPFIAALGLLGGYLTPIIVSTGEPAALPLFAFLFALTAASLAAARYRGWLWLSLFAMLGANAWAMLWAGTTWQEDGASIFALYLIALAFAFVWCRHDLFTLPEQSGASEASIMQRWPKIDALTSVSFAGLFLNAFCFVRLDHYGLWSIGALFVLAAFALFQGRRKAVLIALPGLAALTVLAMLASWHLPQFVAGPEPLIVLESGNLADPRAPIVPPALQAFVFHAIVFAALFALGGYAARRGALSPGAWASLSAAMPLAIHAIVYWRIENFAVSLPWAAASLALAGLALLAALRSERGGPALKGAFAAYSVATLAAIALAATMELREAWLSVALSLLLPATAWIAERLEVKALRWASGIIAAWVMSRILFNQTLLSGSPIGQPLFNWLLYGYGLPALAFTLAARSFRKRGDDWLVALLEAGAVLFTTLLITFEIRSFFDKNVLSFRTFSFVELATQILGWLGLAIGLFWINRQRARPVLTYSWWILGALAGLSLWLGPLTSSNPIWQSVELGDWPIWNLLALAYLAPALLFALGAWLLRHWGSGAESERLATAIAGFAGLFLFVVWSSLEVRHAFQGSDIAFKLASDGEWYAYSLLWLVEAGGLLVLGIHFQAQVLRHLGLGFLSLVVLKVFLWDMSTLTGLYRALSFLGLGGSLIAIGFLYQRFVFPPKGVTQNPNEEADSAGRQESL